MVKNPTGCARDVGLIPGSGRSPGAGNDNPSQYSCLKTFFFPKNLYGQRSLVGYSPQGCKESDMTENTHACMPIKILYIVT